MAFKINLVSFSVSEQEWNVSCRLTRLGDQRVEASGHASSKTRQLRVFALDDASDDQLEVGASAVLGLTPFELPQPAAEHRVAEAVAEALTAMGWGPHLPDSEEESAIAVLAMVGTIYASRPVSESPNVRLLEWQVYALQEGCRRMVGYDPDECDGRVSTPVVSFHPNTASLTTESGRHYELLGPPGYDSDAHYVWRRWLKANGHEIGTVSAVTDDVWAAIQSARNCGGTA